MTRRLFTLSTAALVGALVLTACGAGSGASTGADGVTTIRFAAAVHGSNGDSPSRA
ncbi:hypothetical protein ACFU3J_07635 [Streptomyces sp. NPDC057411]|uniref:hypothetical protein n=1 Tax=unclassified Streptomyces TaxID=2593676 RepID=UPI0036264BB9